MPLTAVETAERHLAAADPVIGALIEQHGACTLARKRRDPFHVLCSSIIGQQLSVKAADTIQARVETALNVRGRLQAQPILDSTHDTLRACGLSNAKARWLRALAEARLDGRLDFRRLARLDDDAAIAALDALPGIGPWTAEMFLIFAMNRLDIFSMGDVGLRRSIDQLYGKGRKLSDRRTTRITRAWAPYRSVASWYLWRRIDGDTQNWS